MLPPARRCPRLQRLYIRFGLNKPFSLVEACNCLVLSIGDTCDFLRHDPSDDFVRCANHGAGYWMVPIDPRNLAGRRFKAQYLQAMRDMKVNLTPDNVGLALGIPSPSAAYVMSLLLRNKSLRLVGGDTIEPRRRRVIDMGKVSHTDH